MDVFYLKTVYNPVDGSIDFGLQQALTLAPPNQQTSDKPTELLGLLHWIWELAVTWNFKAGMAFYKIDLRSLIKREISFFNKPGLFFLLESQFSSLMPRFSTRFIQEEGGAVNNKYTQW